MADTIGSEAADYIWGNELYDIHMTPPVGAKPDAPNCLGQRGQFFRVGRERKKKNERERLRVPVLATG